MAASGAVAVEVAALSAMAAYWTAATTVSSRSAGGSAAGAARARLLATGVNSATWAWHCSHERRCSSKAAMSSGSRAPKAHPATSGWSRVGVERPHPVEGSALDRAQREIQSLGDLALGKTFSGLAHAAGRSRRPASGRTLPAGCRARGWNRRAGCTRATAPPRPIPMCQVGICDLDRRVSINSSQDPNWT